MIPLDLRTIFFSYVIVNFISLGLIGSLYFQIRKRFPGTLTILISFCLSTLGNILLFLRGLIPDWVSIPVANTMIVSSTVILLIGLERFVKKEGPQFQNYILVIAFFMIHSYFTFFQPDLKARNLNLSIAYLIMSFQIAHLMLKRTPPNMRTITRPVGLVFCAVFVIQMFHIFSILKRDSTETNYFSSDSTESVFLLAWLIIFIVLSYSIILMYNRRLIISINIQEEKFSKAFHGAPFIILLSKLSDGKIFEVNKSVKSISGYTQEELINSHSMDLSFWKNEKDRDKFISELQKKGNVIENEYEFRKKSSGFFTGLISAATIDINNEECIISVISDNSKRKQAEVNLQKSEASLRKLNSTKDKFFSIIAHDLKSPFNGILGFSELLKDQVERKDYAGIEQYARIINKSAQQAFDLITNLLDWSRIQTNRMEYTPEYIEMVELILSVCDVSKISAEQKSISIEYNLPGKLIVKADRFMLETVFRNLVSNAIKFTPENGTVRISAEENENGFLFFVNDTGIGIEPENIKKLFRIDGDFSLPGTNNETGTGLGLILCKDFIEKHNGKIWVESEPGLGSSFYFSLPKM